MPYDHKEFKLKFNTHSSHILHTVKPPVTWWKQCYVTLINFSIGLLRLAAMFSHRGHWSCPTHSPNTTFLMTLQR